MKEYKLGDIVTFNYGKSLPKTKRVDGSVPVMSSAGITGWHNKAIIEGPGVIVGRKGSIGTVFYEKRDFYPIDTCYFVTVNDPEILDLKFTYYLLLGSNLKDLNSDAAVPGLNREIAYSQKFKIPSKNVQLKIVKLVDDYNNLIENNNRRIDILEAMAQSLYREWFVNFRYPSDADNLDKYGNKKLIDSPLGKIPDGWPIVALEDVCSRVTDGSHKSPKSVVKGVPMASVKDMHDFGINIGKCRQISNEDYQDLKRQDSVVKANDILVAKDGSYLKHTFVVQKDLEMALLSSIAIIRPNEKVKPHWLAYCLRSRDVKERMKNCVSGAAIPRIILKDFRKFKIFVPPQHIMAEWNFTVELMVKQCWNLVARNENLKQQRDMLLPKLISGQIELKD
jgi:type I restriction enzyme S subunit